MPFSETTKNGMLDSRTFSTMQLHSGDPGVDGLANAESTKDACTFNAATGGTRPLNADVAFTGLTPSVAISHYSVWNGATFEGSSALTGDAAANAAGEYTVLAVGTTLNINDV